MRASAPCEPALGELLDAPGEALLEVVLVPRARRLAVELAPLLGELAHRHRLERCELGGDVVELAHRGAGSGGRLVVHRASVVRARTVLARRRHDGFFPGRRQGESRRAEVTTYLRARQRVGCAAPCATCRERLGEDVSRLVETSLDLGAAHLGAHGAGRGPRTASSGSSLPQVGNAVPRAETGQEIVTDLHPPLTGEALFSI